MRILDVDENGALRADTLEEAVRHDISDGLIPFCVIKIA